MVPMSQTNVDCTVQPLIDYLRHYRSWNRNIKLSPSIRRNIRIINLKRGMSRNYSGPSSGCLESSVAKRYVESSVGQPWMRLSTFFYLQVQIGGANQKVICRVWGWLDSLRCLDSEKSRSELRRKATRTAHQWRSASSALFLKSLHRINKQTRVRNVQLHATTSKT